MEMPTQLHRGSLALLTDFYQLTMAYGYWKSGNARKEAVFNLFFRENPFQSGFSIFCGLSAVIDYLDNFRFEDSDIDYLTGLRGNDQKPLFEPEFLDSLRAMKLKCDIDAVPEGTVVFAHEPLIRVQGPIVQSQLLESFLLNAVNFQTLIATKAARICYAAKDQPVLEFGLRRAQGIDGSLSASRAAYIGGCEGTSNVLAGRLFGIPVRGTHGHSWVMSFEEELEAFLAYAEALPNNCVVLVDTYDTLEGVRKAVEVGKRLRERGHQLLGIRLDSGDLAYLSIEARKILDAGGFSSTVIVASNDLDEHIIASLKDQGATICVWGVGTRLVTGYDQPALGGVYKLTALRRPGEAWQYKLKLSEQTAKISTPGILQVRRYLSDEGFVADAVFDLQSGLTGDCTIVHPLDFTRRKRIPQDTRYVDLQVPIYREGQRVYAQPPLAEARNYARKQLEQLHPGIRRFVNPHVYPVGIEQSLHDLKTRLILQARNQVAS
jgi:nicotinate phosphoribosyltransferase